MAKRASDLQDPQADRPAVPPRVVQNRAPVPEQESPADSARRAVEAPDKLAPRQALALQHAVGNRAVQRHLNSNKRDTALQGVEMAQEATFNNDPKTATLWLGLASRALVEGSEVTEGGGGGGGEGG